MTVLLFTKNNFNRKFLFLNNNPTDEIIFLYKIMYVSVMFIILLHIYEKANNNSIYEYTTLRASSLENLM